MGKTINILGDTPKQQWLSAINIMHFAIQSNIEFAINARAEEEPSNIYFDTIGGDDDEVQEALEKAHKLVDDFAAEMKHLVEGVFDDADEYKEE